MFNLLNYFNFYSDKFILKLLYSQSSCSFHFQPKTRFKRAPIFSLVKFQDDQFGDTDPCYK